ncbi:MAG: hypothetical protein EAZ85_15985 [Bacteroidetes bacterium]|nr:MAG: hypothetical protein EAZ85_15985 [Bacteroidota bacterium]TAG85396.1 MAG: hypothetical protein EAZ20_15260 [Bacteroidota bacterium]
MSLWLLIGINITTIIAQNEQDSLWNVFEKDTNLIDLSPPKYPLFLDIGLSANAYSGDLSSYQKWTALYHFGLSFNQNKKWNGRVNLSFGFITGENRTYQSPKITEQAVPNTFFSTSLLTLSYELRYNFIKTKRFALYASQGFGLMQFTPKNEEGQKLVDIFNTRPIDEVYSNVSVFLPTAVGANYWLKNGYGVGLQASLLNPQTDYLDNISALGTKNGNDQILQFRFFVLAPLRIVYAKKMPERRRKNNFTHQITE